MAREACGNRENHGRDEGEGHGFAKPTNRLKFYELAESFLAKHL